MKQPTRNNRAARTRTVVKANELIQKSRFTLTLQQQRIMLYLISQISRNDEDFKLYKFNIMDFCRVCGIDCTNGKNYIALKASIKEIADKSIWVKLDNGKETLLRWIERPYLDEKSGTIEIKFDKDMKPYLLQLKQNYTQYELLWTLRFQSKYSVRLYELIKSVHFHEREAYEKVFPLDELRTLLDAGTYPAFKDFRVRVLQPAVDEINAYSDKSVSFEPVKQSRSVVAVRFDISTKSPAERIRLQSEAEKELGTDSLTLWDKLAYQF